MRGPIGLLTDAFTQFRENPKLYAGIYIIPAIVTFLGGIYFEMFATDLESGATPVAGEVVVMVLVGLTIFVVSIFMAVAMLRAVIEPSETVRSAYQFAKGAFFRYLLLALLLSVVMVIGFMLLVIPGIIFMVWFAFAYYVLIREGAGVIEAMKRSKELTSGHWWQVFYRILMLALFSLVAGLAVGLVSALFGAVEPNVLPGIVSLLFNIILVPVSLMYMNNLYTDLRTAGKVEVDTETEHTEASATPPTEDVFGESPSEAYNGEEPHVQRPEDEQDRKV